MRNLEDDTVGSETGYGRPELPGVVDDLHAGRRATFASLKIRNFRLFATAQLLSNVGAWMQRIAQDWLVFTLTNSPMDVGITTAMQFLPMLLFGLLGGVIADRYPKRTLLLITQSVACLLAAALATLSLTHVVAAWHVWAIAFGLGMVTVVDNPTRYLFVNEMVGPHYLRNAISLNSSLFQLGGLVGPALGGVLINAFGSGYAFLINTITYLPVIAALLLIDRRALTHAPVVPRSKHQLREGLRYVRSRPRLVWPIVLAGFVGAFGLNMPIVLSAFSKNIFHVGASGYGLLNAMVAIGSMGGALRSASQPVSRLRSIVGAAAAFGTIEALAALAPGLILFGVMLIAVGAASLTFLTAASATVHTTAEDAIRGRVMSLYLLVLLGGTPIGGPVIGYIAEHFGVRTAMLTCGVLPAAAAFVVAVVIGRSDFRPRARLQLIGTWATRLAR